jgi:hypothetical protein
MQASVAVAERAAKAAELSAKTTELSLLSAEILYLYPVVRPHGIKVENFKIQGFEFGNDLITYCLKNFGRTPAVITEVFAAIRLSFGMPPPILPGPPNPFFSLVFTKRKRFGRHAVFDDRDRAVYGGKFDADRDIFHLMAMFVSMMFLRMNISRASVWDLPPPAMGSIR